MSDGSDGVRWNLGENSDTEESPHGATIQVEDDSRPPMSDGSDGTYFAGIALTLMSDVSDGVRWEIPGIGENHGTAGR